MRRIVAALVCGGLLAGCGGTAAPGAQPSSPSSAEAATSESPPSTEPPAEYQPIPGTRIALRVPEQMQVDPSLPGLARSDSRTSVIVLDQARPTDESPGKVLDDMAAAFGDEGRAAREGIDFDEPQRAGVAGHPAVIATGTQTQGGLTFRKALVAIATEDSLVLMTSTAEPGDPIGDELVAVLRDARWTGQRAPSGLAIDVTAAPGYQQVPSSGSVLLALGGATGPNVPLFQASPSMGSAPVPVDQRRVFAEQRFRQLPGSPSPQAITETTIAELPGWELVGDTSDETVFSAILFTADGYVIMVGLQPKGEPNQLPAFRQMATSLIIEE